MAGDPELILQELSNELMSPYCPGRTIAACPSPNARKLEDHILAEAKTGKTREEIEQQLVGRFGEEIVGYTAPSSVLYGSLIVGLLALGGLGWAGRKWVRGPKGGPAFATGTEGRPASKGGGGDGGTKPSRAELDALEDALDEEDGF